MIYKKTAGKCVSPIQGGVLGFETNTTFESFVYNRPQGLFFSTGSSGHEIKVKNMQSWVL
jgi:hypothetical protein